MAGQRLTNLDILRAMAALSVCLFHFNQAGFLGIGWVEAVLRHGDLGVEVFFVISGFVIPLALSRVPSKWADMKAFLVGRFIRLYPAYFLTGVLTIALWHLSTQVPGFRGEAPDLSSRQLLGNLFMICDFIGEDWLIPVFWTLAIEAQYYLLIALSYRYLLAGTAGVRHGVLAVWVAAPLLIGMGPTVLSWTALFAMGILSCLWQEKKLPLRFVVLWLLAAFVVHGMVVGWMNASVGLTTVLAIRFLPPISSRALVHVGLVSYSLYLLHVPVGVRVVNLAQRFDDHLLLRIGAMVVALGVSLGAAVIFYRWVEKPSHESARRVRDYLSHQRPPRA